MKIHLLSDLHLEFSEFTMPKVDSEIRIFAGDIHTKTRGVPYVVHHAEKIPTIYVAGNHEFYGTAVPKLYDQLKAATAGTRVTVLENEAAVIGDVRFLGCTLWTDFALFGSQTRDAAMLNARENMTDYRKIRLNPTYRKLTPSVTLGLHRSSLLWLQTQLESPFSGKTVVVTHHAPSRRSAGSEADLIEAAYCSDLDDFISRYSIDLWIHGHTHRCVDYQIGRTRILSNQRGYPGESPNGFEPALVVEL